MKCKNQMCRKEATEPWWYCSKECAPFGTLGGSRDTKSEKMDLSSSRAPGGVLVPSRPFGRTGARNTYPKNIMTHSEIMNGKDSGDTTMKTERSISITSETNGEKNQVSGEEIKTSKDLSEETMLIPRQNSVEPSEILNRDKLQSMNLIERSVDQLSGLMRAVRDEVEASEKINPNLINSAANCAGQIQKLLKLKMDMFKNT